MDSPNSFRTEPDTHDLPPGTGDAVRDDAPRKELHRELAVLRFLRGPSGCGGEGSWLLVPIGTGAGQEVRRAGPGNRRVERHRQRAHATCMIFGLFVSFFFFFFFSVCTLPPIFSHSALFLMSTLAISSPSTVSLEIIYLYR